MYGFPHFSHKALIVCINDARDAQFINDNSLRSVVSDPLRVEYIYNDTGKLDRNYFRLIVSSVSFVGEVQGHQSASAYL